MIVPKSNPILTRNDWEKMRAAALKDPGKFHGDIAKSEIFWFEKKYNAWIKKSDKGWIGYNATTGKKIESIDLPNDYNPWDCSFDESNPPFYKWFSGGLTNACFNEIDVHLMAGKGNEIAFIFEGDRWDPSFNNGKGGPVVQISVTRKELFWQVAKHAQVLKDFGLEKGDRIVLNMPNILSQIYFTEAAKRLGIIYTPVFGGFSAKTISDRIQDAGAKVVITADGAYRNAQMVSFKEVHIDKALDDYIPVAEALNRLQETLKQYDSEIANRILESVKNDIKNEITLEPSEVMQSLGKVLTKIHEWDAAAKSKFRTRIAEVMVKPQSRVMATIVVQHTKKIDLNWKSRDRWSHELLDKATKKLGQGMSEEAILKLPDHDLIKLVYTSVPPLPVDAETPLLIMYTSGSTGKPKGLVHTHGGYIAGVAHTMRIAFDVNPDAEKPEVIYVVADPGWITGQSYMISAALTTRTTSVITEGSPLFPDAGRFTSIIERYKVNIFKAGATFLKEIAKDPKNIEDVKKYDCTSLRVGTFCAEPINPFIQQFAMDLLTPQYINSYWATEHGGIILTHFYGNKDLKLAPNACTFPLPWIFADVWIAENEGQNGAEYRPAAIEEKGEIVITKPFPYLARTIWGDPKRFIDIYYSRWKNSYTYTQGDFACKYEDGSMSLHGRSDDVINTSGHRIGTEEIETAILKDKQLNPNSVIGNAIVVGAPHEEKGTVPVAFILTQKGKRFSMEDEKRLINLVREEKGALAVPVGFICVTQFPETASGKYMRRYLRKMLEGEALGDTSTLRNPDSLKEIAYAVSQWKQKMELKNKQKILEVQSTLRVEYHEIRPGESLAIIIIDNPPVNALNERALDELNTTINHLANQADIKVIIITGAGTKSFVAGADIRQLLEEMHAEEDVLPLSHKAATATHTLETLNKPVIAAVNGLALGGGNEFQMAAHYRIAETTARFGQPEINLHLFPGYGGTQRLPRILSSHLGEKEGLVEAAEIIIGGRTIDAEEALRLGLINEISNNTDALSRAVTMAREYILGNDTILTKEHSNRLKLNKEWAKSTTFPQSFYTDPEVLRLLKQSMISNREIPAKLAVEAIEYGYVHGFAEGIENEAKLFAKAVIDPKCGKFGIQAFFDKKSAPLPTHNLKNLNQARLNETSLLSKGDLLPPGTPFYPDVTPIPRFQYAQLVERNTVTGKVDHGDPAEAERLKIIPVPKPEADEALLYMLTSEINFNDIWAITGIPVSTFEEHEEDWHVTGSGGLGLVAAVGSDLKKEGRIKVGDMVAVFSGQSQLLSPIAGLDPMFAEQKIQGYQTPDGSHQQFMIVQGPQMFHKLPDLTLEAAGSYMLNLGTIYRALYTTLKIKSGKTLFVEGAATGTGLEAVKAAAQNGLSVIGLVSNEERAKIVLEHGGKATINRKESPYKDIYTKVPEDPKLWEAWEKAGEILLKGGGVDYSMSHAGETSFPRSFQMLKKDGILTFYGASTGYHFTFIGKPGTAKIEDMLIKTELRAGESVLTYYGTEEGIALDRPGIECIEALISFGARIVVCTHTDIQKEFIKSMGFGQSIKGVFSIEEIKRQEGGDFSWPKTMPSLPDPKRATEAFKEAVRWYQDHVFKPIATQVGSLLKTIDSSRNYPDLIIERASQDTLALSTMLVKPYTGRVVYFEDMSKKRYSFYAPQVWMRQRRIYMPSSGIFGTHLSNSYEILAMNNLINAGFLSIDNPLVVEFDHLKEAHQEMWENKHRASNYVLNHALPQMGLKTKDDLYYAWSLRSNDA